MVINADEWWSTDIRRDDEGNAGNPFTLVADTRSTRFRSLRFPGRTSGEAFDDDDDDDDDDDGDGDDDDGVGRDANKLTKTIDD